MQRVVIDKPYTFIPPRYSRAWHWLVRGILPRKLRIEHGISSIEVLGAEKLSASLEANHGVMLVANHCRPCDPMVLDALSAKVRRPFNVIASWHVFMAGRIQRFLLTRMGGFSVYREGLDRESLKCAIKILSDAKHPLVIFPEGIITRTNDRLVNFMEGPAFMARSAAKQRGDSGKIVIHPVFIRYHFEGDLQSAVGPVLDRIEARLSWQPQTALPLRERVGKIGDALLALKEAEYPGEAREGHFGERLRALEEHLLRRLEVEWTGGRHDGDVVARVKRLRAALLPDLVAGSLSESDRKDRWRQLAEVYLVQQLHGYPGDYLDEPTPGRILETVERFEEDLTDRATPHYPLRAEIIVGDAIEVSPDRDRSREIDPITVEIRSQLQRMLESSRR